MKDVPDLLFSQMWKFVSKAIEPHLKWCNHVDQSQVIQTSHTSCLAMVKDLNSHLKRHCSLLFRFFFKHSLSVVVSFVSISESRNIFHLDFFYLRDVFLYSKVFKTPHFFSISAFYSVISFWLRYQFFNVPHNIPALPRIS